LLGVASGGDAGAGDDFLEAFKHGGSFKLEFLAKVKDTRYTRAGLE
jgi:hypothetical protein